MPADDIELDPEFMENLD
jgi:hypothetical protein